MRVLSIQEPYGTLITLRGKRFETRSWGTKYRGPLLIHTSQKVPAKYRKNPELMALLDGAKMQPGKIIGRAYLVSCIHMTEEFIDFVRKNLPKEYAAGFYEVGRYAWILTNVIPFENPIPAKGSLGLWNYDGPIPEM